MLEQDGIGERNENVELGVLTRTTWIEILGYSESLSPANKKSYSTLRRVPNYTAQRTAARSLKFAVEKVVEDGQRSAR